MTRTSYSWDQRKRPQCAFSDCPTVHFITAFNRRTFITIIRHSLPSMTGTGWPRDLLYTPLAPKWGVRNERSQAADLLLVRGRMQKIFKLAVVSRRMALVNCHFSFMFFVSLGLKYPVNEMWFDRQTCAVDRTSSTWLGYSAIGYRSYAYQRHSVLSFAILSSCE